MRLLNYVTVFNSILFLQQCHGLQTVPIPDDLLGVGQCPTGSFCIDTDYCTQEYYTTKSGLPFYCGPHHQIDSMICCVSFEHVNTDTKSDPLYSELSEEDNKNTKRFLRNSFNDSLLNLAQDGDDDEVDILSLPFTRGEIPGQADHHPFDASFQNPDLESVLEEAIEQELAKLDSSSSTSSKETKSTEALNLENNFLEEPQPLNSPDLDEALLENGAGEAGVNVKGRANQKSFVTCACEKGEKGDRGEPCAPGQIVYIPVFVNNPPTHGAVGPWESKSNTFQQSKSFSSGTPYQQQQRPTRENIIPNPPLHPNPMVIPYNVYAPPAVAPIAPLPNSPKPAQPSQSKIKMTNPQSNYPHLNPSFSTASEILHDRLSRSHTTGSRRRIRRRQRTY